MASCVNCGERPACEGSEMCGRCQVAALDFGRLHTPEAFEDALPACRVCGAVLTTVNGQPSCEECDREGGPCDVCGQLPGVRGCACDDYDHDVVEVQ